MPAADVYHWVVPSPSIPARRGAALLLWIVVAGSVVPACGGGDDDAVTDAQAPSSSTGSVSFPSTTGVAADAAERDDVPASATTSTTRVPAVVGWPSTTTRVPGRPVTSSPKPPVRPSTTAPRSTTTASPPAASSTTTRPPRTTTLPPRPDAFCDLLAQSALADLARLGGYDVTAVDELLGQLSTLRGSAPAIAAPWIDAVTPVIQALRVEVEAGRVTDGASFLIWAAQLAADDPATIDAFRKALFNLNAFYRKRCLV